MLEMVRAVCSYRFFIFSSIRNELTSRFARSKLGGMWMVIHPLAQVLIFALILSEVLSTRLPGIDNKYAYALYLMSGMLAWNLFSEVIGKCVGLFVENANLLKKMSFPRICLPVIAGGTALTNNLLLLAAICLVFACMGHLPGVQALWLPILMALTLLFAMSVGIVLGVLNVFLRDISQVVPILLQVLFWLTPIVYMLEILPERYRHLFEFNPVYPLVASYQNVLLLDQPPQFQSLAVLAAVTAGISIVGLLLFRRANAEMVDLL